MSQINDNTQTFYSFVIVLALRFVITDVITSLRQVWIPTRVDIACKGKNNCFFEVPMSQTYQSQYAGHVVFCQHFPFAKWISLSSITLQNCSTLQLFLFSDRIPFFAFFCVRGSSRYFFARVSWSCISWKTSYFYLHLLLHNIFTCSFITLFLYFLLPLICYFVLLIRGNSTVELSYFAIYFFPF